MNIRIEKKNFDALDTENLKAKCGAALDALWETDWVRYAIAKGDRRQLAELQAAAAKLAGQSEIVLFLAEGAMAKLLSAAVSAAAPEEELAEIIVFGDSLSPADYADLLKRLEDKTFSIVAVSGGEEGTALRGAYATFKQYLISRFGKEQAAERLFAVCGPSGKFFAEEAASEDFPLISAENLPAAFSFNTAPVVLALAAMGVDVQRYLDGFYEMLASPAWDLDATDYAVGRAAFAGPETAFVWQRQLYGAAKFFSHGAMMPEESCSGQHFETLLLVEKDSQDIMMPFFEGCNEDGSLNLLLVDMAEKAFDNEQPGVKLILDFLNDYNLGQLFAFLQLSAGITDYLLLAK